MRFILSFITVMAWASAAHAIEESDRTLIAAYTHSQPGGCFRIGLKDVCERNNIVYIARDVPLLYEGVRGPSTYDRCLIVYAIKAQQPPLTRIRCPDVKDPWILLVHKKDATSQLASVFDDVLIYVLSQLREVRTNPLRPGEHRLAGPAFYEFSPSVFAQLTYC